MVLRLFSGHLTLRSAPQEQEDEARAGDTRSLQEQNEDKANMLTVPPGVDGSSWNNVSERIVKEGGIHDKEIGFMESTMRFGLFCVTVMYFRARWLLHRQRNCASDFKLGWTIDTSVPVRAQSKPVSQMTVSSTQPGYQRVKVNTPCLVGVVTEVYFHSSPKLMGQLHCLRVAGTQGKGASRSSG